MTTAIPPTSSPSNTKPSGIVHLIPWLPGNSVTGPMARDRPTDQSRIDDDSAARPELQRNAIDRHQPVGHQGLDAIDAFEPEARGRRACEATIGPKATRQSGTYRLAVS